jgi:hypothetical protein
MKKPSNNALRCVMRRTLESRLSARRALIDTADGFAIPAKEGKPEKLAKLAVFLSSWAGSLDEKTCEAPYLRYSCEMSQQSARVPLQELFSPEVSIPLRLRFTEHSPGDERFTGSRTRRQARAEPKRT